MTNILHVSASIRGDESVSRKLGNRLVEKLATASEATIVTRDLAANDLPLIDADRFAANLTPHEERDDNQQALAGIADTLIGELQAADTLVLSLPVYNFTMPSTLKAWADLVARAGTTFRYTEQGPEGLLTGKKVYVVIASGGTPMGSEIDFLTPWLRHFLGFLGMTDVEMVAADGIMGIDGEEKIEAASQAIEALTPDKLAA
ncbi:NAD(P)H-dependent oxidoreductase [Citromicrobium bathyomarinum]|uniref:FMN-dependent NADH-azoreductase n=1 Tax=Citromicrobium bathyomarinum TaxID=72174 RepID=UPI00315AD794